MNSHLIQTSLKTNNLAWDCSKTHESDIGVTGRICANPACNHAGKWQDWQNFFKKGKRHTSRCKECIRQERAISYRKKKQITGKKRVVRKVKFKNIVETKVLPVDTTTENDVLETMLRELVSDAILGNLKN